jgi:hypothetical protein
LVKRLPTFQALITPPKFFLTKAADYPVLLHPLYRLIEHILKILLFLGSLRDLKFGLQFAPVTEFPHHKGSGKPRKNADPYSHGDERGIIEIPWRFFLAPNK